MSQLYTHVIRLYAAYGNSCGVALKEHGACWALGLTYLGLDAFLHEHSNMAGKTSSEIMEPQKTWFSLMVKTLV